MFSCYVSTDKPFTPDLTLTLQQKIKQYLVNKYQYARGGLSDNVLMYFVGGDTIPSMKFIISIVPQNITSLQINLASLIKEQTPKYANEVLDNLKTFISSII